MSKKGYKQTEEHIRKRTIAASKTKTGKSMPIKTRKKISVTMKGRPGKKHSEETKRKIGEKSKGRYVSKETKRKMGIAHRGFKHSEESKRKISKSSMGKSGTYGHSGKPHSKESKKKMCKSRLKYFAVHGTSEEGRRKQKISMKRRWEDPVYREKAIKAIMNAIHRKPNKVELKLNKILQQILPGEYKFVGDGKFIIAGRNPDFININGQKKIIELFGDYWHNPKIFPNVLSAQDRIKLFAKYGYKTLIIQEHELKPIRRLGEKILEFNK